MNVRRGAANASGESVEDLEVVVVLVGCSYSVGNQAEKSQKCQITFILPYY
jgi:hypothetical protein